MDGKHETIRNQQQRQKSALRLPEYAQSKPQSRHGQRNNQWRSRGHRSCRIAGDDSENLFFGKNENLFLDEKRFDDGVYQYALGSRR